MALLEALLGKENPFAQWAGENNNYLGALGAGLASGPTFSRGVANGLSMAPQAKMLDREAAEKLKAEKLAENQANATQNWLQANHPDLAQMVQAGMPVSEAWNAAQQRMQPQQATDMPSNIREWEYFTKLPPDQQGQYLRMKRANPYLDVGTGFVQPDPLNPGTTAGPAIVKDNFTPAYDSAFGTASGKADVENTQAYQSLSSKMPGLRAVVRELGEVGKTATYTLAGQARDIVTKEAGMEPSAGAIARTKYIAMVDNQILPLLRDVFGAAFTVKEGETLRATLGDPNKTPAEKQVVLEAFIAQKERDVLALASRVPGAPAASVSDPLDLRGGL